MQERREEHRGRTYLGAEVAFNDTCAAINCLVRNLSQNGAKLVFAEPVDFRGEVALTIHQKRIRRRARAIWQHENEAGLVFVAPGRGRVVSFETAHRLKKLERAVDALAQRVAELAG